MFKDVLYELEILILVVLEVDHDGGWKELEQSSRVFRIFI